MSRWAIPSPVIASAAKQSMALSKRKMDCFVDFGRATGRESVSGTEGGILGWENLHESLGHTLARHCERSEAIHGPQQKKDGLLRRFAPRNDGATWSGSDGLNLRWEDLHESLGHTLARHCERSEAIHGPQQKKDGLLRRLRSSDG